MNNYEEDLIQELTEDLLLEPSLKVLAYYQEPLGQRYYTDYMPYDGPETLQRDEAKADHENVVYMDGRQLLMLLTKQNNQD